MVSGGCESLQSRRTRAAIEETGRLIGSGMIVEPSRSGYTLTVLRLSRRDVRKATRALMEALGRAASPIGDDQ